MEGSVFIFVAVSRSKRVGYLILLFRAKEEKPLLTRAGKCGTRIGFRIMQTEPVSVTLLELKESILLPVLQLQKPAGKRIIYIIYMVIFST